MIEFVRDREGERERERKRESESGLEKPIVTIVQICKLFFTRPPIPTHDRTLLQLYRNY